MAPNNSQKVIFPDYSFVHVSNNGGTDWKQAYLNTNDQNPLGVNTPTKKAYQSIGLENTTCWQMFWADSMNVFGGFSDIGLINSKDKGKTWGFQNSGAVVNSAYRFAKSGNKLYVGTSNIHDMYQSTRLKDALLDAFDTNGKIFFSADGGSNWTILHNFGHPVFWIAVDPNNANKMYASVIHYAGGGAGSQGGIWMTSTLSAVGGGLWTKLPNPPRTEGHPASIVVLNDGKVLCTYSGRYTTNFTASSGVFLYDPATSSWSDKSDPGMQYWTKDIVVDPSDTSQNTWYTCVFSGYGGSANNKGGLYRTTDRGTTWTKLTALLFDRVTSITFNPLNLKQAFLTTETQGLWVTQDISKAIPTFSLVYEYSFRQPERVYFNPYKPSEIWVTSFGNGVKVGGVKPLQSGGVNEFRISDIGYRIFPNPASDQLRIENYELQETQFEIINLLGEVVLSGTLDREKTMIDVSSLTKGIYFVVVDDKRRKLIVL